MKMTSIDDMNIVKDLFLVNTEPATEEETKEKLKETDSSSSETTNVVCSQTVTGEVYRT